MGDHMEVGRINNKLVDNTMETTKNRVEGDNFEKRLQAAMDRKDEKELKKVCQEFEGIFLNMMYRQMKASVPKEELIPEEAGKDIFESMLDDKLMEEASKNSRLGLADTLYKQLSRQLKSVPKPYAGEK